MESSTHRYDPSGKRLGVQPLSSAPSGGSDADSSSAAEEQLPTIPTIPTNTTTKIYPSISEDNQDDTASLPPHRPSYNFSNPSAADDDDANSVVSSSSTYSSRSAATTGSGRRGSLGRKSRRKLRSQKKEIIRSMKDTVNSGDLLEELRHARRRNAAAGQGTSGSGSDSSALERATTLRSMRRLPTHPGASAATTTTAAAAAMSNPQNGSGSGSNSTTTTPFDRKKALAESFDRKKALNMSRAKSLIDRRSTREKFYYEGVATQPNNPPTSSRMIGLPDNDDTGSLTEGQPQTYLPQPTPPIGRDKASQKMILQKMAGARKSALKGRRASMEASIPRSSAGGWNAPGSDQLDSCMADYEDLAFIHAVMENENDMMNEEEAKQKKEGGSRYAVKTIADKYLFNSDDEEEFKDPKEDELKKLRRIASNGIAACLTIIFVLMSMIMMGGFGPRRGSQTEEVDDSFAAPPSSSDWDDVTPAIGMSKEEVMQLLLPMSPKVTIIDSPQNEALEWLMQQTMVLSHERLKQLYVLSTLYYATNGVRWFTNNWLTNLDECSWTGVHCRDSNSTFVNYLNLKEFGLRGTIPSEIGELSELQELYLSNNELSGSIPYTLFKLREAKQMHLDRNRLSGAIPRGIGAMTSLEHFTAAENNLRGRIPNGFGNLRYLTHLDLSHNTLKGEIPLEITQLDKLETFDITDNDIDAMIPEGIDRMKNLKEFLAADNDIFGPLPTHIGLLSRLETIDVSNNVLTGEVPAEIKNLSSLIALKLSNNDLVGSFPPLEDASRLEHLHLDNNKFTGDVPDWLANHASLREVAMERNGLGGEIPSGVCELSLTLLTSDCGGDNPKVKCDCCSKCFSY